MIILIMVEITEKCFGRLVARIDGTQWTRYTYDSEDVIVDTRSDGSRVYYGNAPGIDNKLWYTEEYNNTSSTVFFLTDHLGSTRALVSDSGATLGTITYDSFGLPVGITGTIGTRFLYAGRDYDADTELYYYRARWYDPQARRFISEDPIGLNGGINLYAYVGNNPVNRIDPWGLDAIYINYDYYPVSTPVGKIPLGHAAVVAVDPDTGVTKYYEFGRYDTENRGIVRGAPDIKIPNLIIGADGLPTAQSLDYLYSYLSRIFGKNSKVTATYYPDSDFLSTIKFAEEFRKNHPDYNLLFNNCKTFAISAATACKEGAKCK